MRNRPGDAESAGTTGVPPPRPGGLLTQKADSEYSPRSASGAPGAVRPMPGPRGQGVYEERWPVGKLLRYLRPYRIPVIAVIVLVFAQAIADLYLPNLMSDIVNSGIINGDIEYIVRIGGLMLLVTAGGATCAVVGMYLSSQVAMGYGRILRDEIFTHVSTFSLREFDRLGTPSLVTRTTNDVTQVQSVTLMMMRMMIMAPTTCIGGIIMAISKDRQLAWVFVVVLPLLVAVVVVIATRSFPLFQAIQAKIDRINLVLRETLTGMRVIRAFDRVEHEKARFHAANVDLTETSITVTRLVTSMMPMMTLIMNLTSIAVVWFGSVRIEHGTTNVGDMMAFLQYATQIMFSLMMASLMFVTIPRAQASAARINEILATEPGIVDPPLSRSLDGRRGTVEFKDVTFRYPGAEEPALRDVSFSARPGEVIAVIGSTGSGKSTLINLIPRFYDVELGSVEVDGVDVRDIKQDELRARIGLVPQAAVLFSGTIADNIRYGKLDATDAEVRQAAEIAQATEFIDAMEAGFDSPIAQGGTNVSGGQKQRLSIARAIVARPEIYIFDDSFSALDFRTDARLRAALRGRTSDSTVIIVGQRVATIMDADRIVVLDDGRIAGMGNHRELYRTCRVYQEIVASQLSQEELA
jgi:ATP-binding cassette subfamily B multidrug efflux pump